MFWSVQAKRHKMMVSSKHQFIQSANETLSGPISKQACKPVIVKNHSPLRKLAARNSPVHICSIGGI